MAERDERGRPAGPNDPTRLIIRPTDNNATRALPKAPQGDAQAGGSSAADQTVLVHQMAGAQKKKSFDPVVAWLVVTAGPGRGEFRAVKYGQNSVGRGEDQRICLDIGDEKISRDAHAYVVYDERQRKFFVKDGGKSNLIRRNGEPVLAPTEMAHGDLLSLGDTELTFVAFCGPNFDWLDGDEAGKA